MQQWAIIQTHNSEKSQKKFIWKRNYEKINQVGLLKITKKMQILHKEVEPHKEKERRTKGSKRKRVWRRGQREEEGLKEMRGSDTVFEGKTVSFTALTRGHMQIFNRSWE